jgi:DNA polymerase III psi subunit
MRVLLISFFLIFTITSDVFAQIINIEEKRFRTVDSVHWYGDIDLSMSLVQQQKQLFTTRAAAQIEYKARKHLWLSLTDYALVNSGNNAFENAAFQHLRYNYKFLPKTAMEVYGQVQNNKLQHIDLRLIGGLGLRQKIFQHKNNKTRVYLGVSVLLENNVFKDKTEKIFLRNSNYLSITFVPNGVVKFNTTTYYQPAFGYTNLARFNTQNNLSFNINKHLAFRVLANFAYDPTVPDGIINWTYSLQNGIKWTL